MPTEVIKAKAELLKDEHSEYFDEPLEMPEDDFIDYTKDDE